MPESVTFTLRLPKRIKDGLKDLSDATDRPQSYLFTQALQEYLEAQQWQVQAIRAAVKKADSPGARFIPHGEVAARIKQLGSRPKRARR